MTWVVQQHTLNPWIRIVGADMTIDIPCVGGGTDVALLREVISVDLLPLVKLPCLPPRMASKQEQQLPM